MTYSFKPSKKITVHYKLRNPDNEDVRQAISLFYISAGALANIVQTQIKDTHEYLKTLGGYYKRDIKFHIKEAHNRIDRLMEVFKKYTSEANSFGMWLDITDEMEDKLRPNIQTAYYSLDNHLLKYAKGGDHKLSTHSVLSFDLATMLVILTRDYVNTVFKENPNIPSGFGVSPEYTNLAMGVAKSMASLCSCLIPGVEFKFDKSQLFECENLKVSLDIIFNSLVFSRENIEGACEQALSYGGVNYSKINDLTAKDNDFRNKGTEWNETQVGVLSAYYKDVKNETLAAMLGRSVYEVRKKAKEIGLKKSEKYLKEIRTNNLKKKQNENT